MQKVCIFVDGENFRHTIKDLFPTFDNRKYLPDTDWDKFFDWISVEVAGPECRRVRTYWYAVQNIDFYPFDIHHARGNPLKIRQILSKNYNIANLISTSLPGGIEGLLLKKHADLMDLQSLMEKRFKGWANIHEKIEHNNKSVEFRKAGSIRYDLFERQLGSEKAVDVKLATDLIRLKDIYDIAVIVSGDQDYVPAVSAVKDFGKHIVNVAFKTESGRLLPGGARRLNQATDWSIEINYSDSKRHLNL